MSELQDRKRRSSERSCITPAKTTTTAAAEEQPKGRERRAGLPWRRPSCSGDSWLLQRGRTTHPQTEEYTSYTFRWPQLGTNAVIHSCTLTKKKQKNSHLLLKGLRIREQRRSSLHISTLKGRKIPPSYKKNKITLPSSCKKKTLKQTDSKKSPSSRHLLTLIRCPER